MIGIREVNAAKKPRRLRPVRRCVCCIESSPDLSPLVDAPASLACLGLFCQPSHSLVAGLDPRRSATSPNEASANNEQTPMIVISGQTVESSVAPTIGATSAPNPI